MEKTTSKQATLKTAFKQLSLLLCLLIAEVGAQEKVPEASAPQESSLGQSSRFGRYSTAHLRPTLVDGFDRTGLTILGSGAVLGVIAHQYDRKVKTYFNRHNRLGNTLTDFGNSLGTRYVNIAVAGIQMIWDRSNGLAHLEGLLGTTAMVLGLKYGVHRTRPNGEDEHSFPSGHTSTAFTSSGSLSYAYGAKAAVPAYALTSLTLLARLQDNKHWLSDVVVASSIGIYWARSSGIHHHYLGPIILKEGGGVEFKSAF